MKKERALTVNNDEEYALSKKHSSDENEDDQSPPSKSRKTGMIQTIQILVSLIKWCKQKYWFLSNNFK